MQTLKEWSFGALAALILIGAIAAFCKYDDTERDQEISAQVMDDDVRSERQDQENRRLEERALRAQAYLMTGVK